MSFLSDIADEIRKLPELAKGVTAFAASLAAVEGTLVAVSSTTHIIPSLWLQAVAASVAAVTGVSVILTDLSSNSSVLKKAEDVAAEVGKVAAEVTGDLAGAQANPAPVPTPAPATNPVVAVVTDAENVVNQVIKEF